MRVEQLQNIDESQVFSFEENFPTLFAGKGDNGASQPSSEGKHDLLQALIGAGEAAYHWDIASDTITWSSNASDVLGCPKESIATGRLYANLLEAENLTSRFETVMYSQSQDHGQGVPFQIEYVFRAHGRANSVATRLEDNGRWTAAADGTPKQAYGTVRRVDERHSRDQHLSFLGINDPKTGMMNRGRMTAALTEAINGASKSGGSCALAIVSINHLNLVNNAYGYDVADEVIVAAGLRLKQVMRMGDDIARYSGSKFGIILHTCTDKELKFALSRFLATIRDSVIETSRGPVWITIAIGAAVLPAHGETASLAIAHAEEALSEARQSPSGDYVLYQRSESREADRAFNAHCAAELVKCLGDDSFRLAYQPIVDAKTRLPKMHEALLRVRNGETQELLNAAHLIPLAERLGLVRLIDRAVLQLVVHELEANPELNLSMNISGSSVSDPYWNDQLLDVLKSNSAVASRLTMEISEEVALGDLKSARKFIDSLRETGTSVAIDQFGKRFAAVRHLRELPINAVKLDGSLCRNPTTNPENEYLVKTILDLSNKFNITTVAEWIETPEAADQLTAWGANHLQGHYLGLPILSQNWAEKISSEATPKAELQPELAAPEAVQIEMPSLALPTIEAHTTVEPVLEVDVAVEQVAVVEPLAEPEPTPQSFLDFSEIDDSIAKLRNALDGLTSSAPPVAQKAQSTDAA